MYSFKEKKKHLEELSNKEAAEADLLLLKQAQPTFHSLRTFERNPKRYAQDILYALLDFRTRDEIRMHRRKYINKEEQAELAPKVEQSALKDEKHSSPEEKSASEDEQPENKVVPDPDGELENVKEQLQEAIDRAELAEEEKESLQEKLECEQEAREQAEQTLEKEKKKEPKKPREKKNSVPKKSKSTKNTQK